MVQSRREGISSAAKIREGNKYLAIESCLALAVAFITNAAVIGSFAAGFYSKKCDDLYDSAKENYACVPNTMNTTLSYGSCKLQSGVEGHCATIGLSEAGTILSSWLGKGAEMIWALGLLAAGQVWLIMSVVHFSFSGHCRARQ